MWAGVRWRIRDNAPYLGQIKRVEGNAPYRVAFFMEVRRPRRGSVADRSGGAAAPRKETSGVFNNLSLLESSDGARRAWYGGPIESSLLCLALPDGALGIMRPTLERPGTACGGQYALPCRTRHGGLGATRPTFGPELGGAGVAEPGRRANRSFPGVGDPSYNSIESAQDFLSSRARRCRPTLSRA